jgi:hypothetical protein
MALSPDEVLSIATILSKDDSLINAQITVLGADMTAERLEAIRAQLTRWTALGGKFVRIVAKESNKGVETNSNDAKDDIREALAILLRLPMYSTAGIGTMQIG